MFALLWANPLARKLTLYAAMAGVILLAWRWHSNKIREIEYWKGKASEAQIELKAKQAEWDKREAEITKTANTLQNAINASQRDRAAIQGNLSKGLAEIDSRLLGIAGTAESIPSSDLDKTIKRILIELRQ